MPFYTVTVRRTVYQEFQMEGILGENPEQAEEFARADLRKYSERIESTYDITEIDTDLEIELVEEELTEEAPT